MLLGLMRKHAKSWLIKAMIAIIALVFIFYFGYSFTSKQVVKVAVVNGEIIKAIEYDKEYRSLVERFQNEYKSLWSDTLIKTLDLENRALNNLIEQKLISQEAKRIGLDITSKEIQNQILSYPAFLINGHFDVGRYRSLLTRFGMKPEDFEEDISRELLQKKLAQFLMTLLPVSDQEILDRYNFLNREVKIAFIHFKPDSYKGDIKPDRQGLEAYFNENKEDYRVPEMIKISYIMIAPDTFKGDVHITEEQIRDYYEYNLEDYKEEEKVRARHILFRLESDAPEEKVKETREKALSVLEKARSGGDFAKLAKTYSEGPTKTKGGDLGWFSRGKMVKEFEEAAFRLKKGEISDLVRTSFGFHIIKIEDRTEATTKSLTEVKEEIKQILIKREAMNLAYEKAMSLQDKMPYDVDLEQYAKQHGVPIEQSPFFAGDDPVPGIGGDDKLKKTLFSLQQGEVSELVEIKDRLYLIQVIDKKPSKLPEMDKVLIQVEDDYADHLAREKTKAVAEKYLEQLLKGSEWDTLAKEQGLKPEMTDFFSLQSPPPQIGYAPNMQEILFGLTKDKRYPEKVLENDSGIFVVRWEEEKDIDLKKYESVKERYRQTILLEKNRVILEAWMDQLKKNADIERTPFERL